MKKKLPIISISLILSIILVNCFCLFPMNEEKYSKFQIFNPSKQIETSNCGAHVDYFTTNRQVYYINENIIINSSWTKSSDPYDECFFQIHIINWSYNIIWESASFYEDGHLINTFNVSIEDDLDLDFEGQSTYLTVGLFYYTEDPHLELYWAEKPVKILREGNFSISNSSLNKNAFYEFEDINFNITYDLLYDTEYETGYMEIRIFNTTQDLIWNSTKYTDQGLDKNNNFDIPIQELALNFSESQTLNFTVFFFYNSTIRELHKTQSLYNETITIISLGGFTPIELSVLKEDVYEGGIITINAIWELDYEPPLESAYIRIKIYDYSDIMMWESPKYDNASLMEKTIYIDTFQLDLQPGSYYACFSYHLNSSIIPLEVEDTFFNSSFTISQQIGLFPYLYHSDSEKRSFFTNNAVIFPFILGIPALSIVVLVLISKKEKLLEDLAIEL
jgi:hypothetical protein